MASYSIVSNARFRPFSYDELVKPLVQYKEAYDKAEADYTNLAMQTEAWRDIANQENSPVAYKMYKTYSDDLSRMVDDFSKGMTLSNRGALMGLKRRYASEITPIARASEAFDKAARTMGMPYPGGILLDMVADEGNEKASYLSCRQG